ncbi:acetyl-CoA acetyltransferase [Haematobia irritans]|uniref:acetyl-CoA acetyltransferase n=1 Tax=Haematobia irritans TaxID=7368 RepID=UPI003F50B220
MKTTTIQIPVYIVYIKISEDIVFPDMQALLNKINILNISFKTFRIYRHLHLDTKSIVIASAVRSPWGLPLGQLSSIKSSDLLSMVIETVVKQSGAPLEKIKNVYIAKETHMDKVDIDDTCGKFLKKSNFISIENNQNVGLESLSQAINVLKSQKCDFVALGGVVSASQQLKQEKHRDFPMKNLNKEFGERCKTLHEKYMQQGLYDSELVTLKTIRLCGTRRMQVEMTQDEVGEFSCNEFDGASALVLTTQEKALEYNIKPLALIKAIEIYETEAEDGFQSQLSGFKILVTREDLIENSQIDHCEVNNSDPLFLDIISNFLNIHNDQINPYGSPCLGQESASYLYGAITHMTHTLKPKKIGCLVNHQHGKSMAIILEKLTPPSSPGALPRLTLFTVEPCHLCDLVVEDLEQHFSGEYELEKIYLDTKENIRYLRLYRNDIPVLYLNGQFLCMHRLNKRLLRQKLNILKQL